MKVTKSVISTEVAILKLQIEVVRSEKSNADKIIELINLQKNSNFWDVCNQDALIEWFTDQVINNDLPEMSSGSFVTALGDIDNLIAGLDIEENEELCEYAKSILKY
jgi:hypothetical protein